METPPPLVSIWLAMAITDDEEQTNWVGLGAWACWAGWAVDITSDEGEENESYGEHV